MSEADLQEHLEVQLRDRVIEFARIPDEVLKWVYANKEAPQEVRDAADEHLRGFPDALMLKRIDGSPYCLALLCELKTPAGKLRTSQRKYFKRLNYTVPRSKEEIDEAIKLFEEAEVFGLWSDER